MPDNAGGILYPLLEEGQHSGEEPPKAGGFLHTFLGDRSADEIRTSARVLQIIRRGPTSRTEIARVADISRPVVSEHVERLLAVGLIREAGVADSTGGRRARLVSFNQDAGCVAGVDLGATGMEVAIADLAGRLLAHTVSQADLGDGPERCLAEAHEVILSLLDARQIPRRQLKAVTIGVPGPVEFSTGRPVSPPLMPGWDDYPVRDHGCARFGVPFFVDNDVNLMALGEQWAGLGRDVEDFLFVKVGTGIGCGIVCRGNLYRGADGCAGNIGHIEVCGQSQICHCGNIGCLEAVAAAPAWVTRAQTAAAAGHSPLLTEHLARQGTLTAREVGELAARGDAACLEIIRESGRLIGQVLASQVNFFNPALIVVGGGVSGTHDSWLASIRQEVYRRSLPLASRNLVIRRSQVGNRVGVIGGAALSIQQLFSDVA